MESKNMEIGTGGMGLTESGLLWFGAGVSVAEIITGTYIASLGFEKGLLANLIGHGIGCVLLFLAGVIGGTMRKSAMESVKVPFGNQGGKFFSFMNVMQLAGWTSIMIYDGALAANGIFPAGQSVWSICIGMLIVLWLMVGVRNLEKINAMAVAGLFILTLVLCKAIFFGSGQWVSAADDGMTFGGAVELSAAMPLSWLPLISDYTRDAKEPVKASGVSAVVYGLVSCWMYVIGMGAAICTGEYDIAMVMLKAGLGIAGLLIVVFSTVTTTYLDAYSAGVSSQSLWHKVNEKYGGIVVAAVGTVAAIFSPMDNITPFLYLIGSIFAPMIAIQIVDFFILKNGNKSGSESVGNPFNFINITVWVIGFIIYRNLMTTDLILGNTLPDMIITGLLCYAANKVFRRK